MQQQILDNADHIPYVIVPFGGPGSGKSTLCNFLVDGEDSDTFLASATTEGSETKVV